MEWQRMDYDFYPPKYHQDGTDFTEVEGNEMKYLI